MITAIIPARGGSKGIPKKNLLPLCGKPLVAYSIEQALNSACDEVYVTTDDLEIASVSESYGARVINRPPELATDEAASEGALLHALACMSRPELVVFLQPTSPIRQPYDIDGALYCLERKQADSLFSARVVEGYRWIWGKGQLTPTYRHRYRRQEASGACLEENGSIYVFKPQVLQAYGQRLGGEIECYLMDPLDSLQLDEPHQIAMFEQLICQRLHGQRITK